MTGWAVTAKRPGLRPGRRNSGLEFYGGGRCRIQELAVGANAVPAEQKRDHGPTLFLGEKGRVLYGIFSLMKS